MLQLKAIKLLVFISLFFSCFSVSTASFAQSESSKISQKLWHKLSDSDLEYLKKTYRLLEYRRYDEAMSYAQKLRENIDKSIVVNGDSAKESFSEAIS